MGGVVSNFSTPDEPILGVDPIILMYSPWWIISSMIGSLIENLILKCSQMSEIITFFILFLVGDFDGDWVLLRLWMEAIEEALESESSVSGKTWRSAILLAPLSHFLTFPFEMITYL